MRVGIGYDVHQLVEGRPLILGGIPIEHPKGLLGHSDADILTHTLIDALLGAAGLGSIGTHFPDTDPRYKGISSLELLSHVHALIQKEGYSIGNMDATIVAQKPKLAPHIPAMKKNLAEQLGISETSLNIKATTSEWMGFVGREEGMACHAVALIHKG